jgi:hypothetical protein
MDDFWDFEQRGYGDISIPKGTTLMHTWELKWYLVSEGGYTITLTNDRNDLQVLCDDYGKTIEFGPFLEQVLKTQSKPWSVYVKLPHRCPYLTTSN